MRMVMAPSPSPPAVNRRRSPTALVNEEIALQNPTRPLGGTSEPQLYYSEQDAQDHRPLRQNRRHRQYNNRRLLQNQRHRVSRREFEPNPNNYYNDQLADFDGGAGGGSGGYGSSSQISEEHQAFLYEQLGFSTGGRARRFKSRREVLARARKTQPDYCCTDCIALDCSCSSAISSGNDVTTEDNFQHHPIRQYHVSEDPEVGGNQEGAEIDRVTCLESELHTSTTLMGSRIITNNMATVSHHNNTNNIHKVSSGGLPCHKQAALERGLAMNEEERKSLGLLGLLPAAIQDQELQAKAVINFLENCKDELGKYVYLRNLKDFNENLFYYTLMTNVEKCMPLVYTPTVGLACQKFSEIYMRPRGIFVTIRDIGRVKEILANWSEKDVRVIVVTDGERILGLGDLGANGMGISIGKLSLYTALAGIPPQNVLPVTIDVGTNNEANLKDPFYIGLRQHRVRGDKYDQLIDEFLHAVVDRWGRSCLVQFEDFANITAFSLLKRYRDDYCTFNDDIQGTASVCLSGLISAAKLIGKRLRDCSFLFYGAGEANLGAAHLLVMAMMEDGLGEIEAKRHIRLVDSKGLVVSSRTDLNEHKQSFAHEGPQIKDLEEIIQHTKPTSIIGASAQGGAFTESICKKMAQYNERPIIFALSNPTSKAECTASQAYEWTNGKCVFASGSPFDPVEHDGKTYITGQGNNAYIFPGVGLAAIAAHTHIIPEETFLVAARALSDQVTANDMSVGLVYPRLSRIRDVTLRVATRVLEYFYSERLATYRPEPSDKREFLKCIQYNPRY